MKKLIWNLQLFGEEGEVAAPESAAPAGTETAAEVSTEPVTAGMTMSDGSKVQDARVAAALERQMKKHPELRQVYFGQGQPQKTQAPARQTGMPAEQKPAVQGAEASGDTTRMTRWEELKKGEFADLFGQDVKKAIDNRFKNQADAGKQLEKLAPMLEILRQRAGVENDDDLVKRIMDDDSLYEEEASERGMTVQSLKEFKAMERELQEKRAAEERSFQDQMLHNHFDKLVHQAEELRKRIPDFDLQAELKNPEFLKLTSPQIGVSVDKAYFAVHHDEMMPQAMAMGMQRAQQQMGQTIQAQGRRPAEGAMKNGTQAANDLKIDPKKLTPKERAKYRALVMSGKEISFD